MRLLYERLIPYETRFWLYKLRHQQEFKDLRTVVHDSPKGNFSLRAYDQKKCIFVHITKTAGTSIAKGLFGELPYHYTATQYRVIYGRRIFNDYFKFAFVRNPWDRLHSAFTYLKKGGWNEEDRTWAEKNLQGIDDFDKFVMEWLTVERLHSHIHFWPQMDFVADRFGNALIDDLAYFETITEDYQRLATKLGTHRSLPHANTSEKIDYKQVYTSDSIEKVRQIYANDINAFGYRFDSYQRMSIHNKQFVPTCS